MGLINKKAASELEQSLDRLEAALRTARDVVSDGGADADLVGRFRSYEEVLAKQRSLARGMLHHAAAEDWNEVRRHLRLINGLSRMIRDDARSLVNPQRTESAAERLLPI